MFNIGIDFGSTYTTVSAYRNETEKLETVVWPGNPVYSHDRRRKGRKSLTDFATAQPQKALWEERTMSLIAISLCWRNSVLQQNSITKTIVQKRIVSRKNNTQEM